MIPAKLITKVNVIPKVNKAISYEEAIEQLNEVRGWDGEKWGVYFLGTQLTMGKTRVYASYGTAKRRVTEEIHNWNSDKDETKAVIQHLEDSGLLEIKQLSHRGPKFPRNIKGLDEYAIKRFETMLDADDSDMVNLGITILKELNKNSKDEKENTDR
jgi:succinate dehydrogenase flavin-adding protein (antitoxin of CptAB toxin-antitoxin module)